MKSRKTRMLVALWLAAISVFSVVDISIAENIKNIIPNPANAIQTIPVIHFRSDVADSGNYVKLTNYNDLVRIDTKEYNFVLRKWGSDASGRGATILWWNNNHVNNGDYSTIIAWSNNDVEGSSYGVIWWGNDNVVSDNYWTVAGWESNTAGNYSAVVGGKGNIAAGEYSVALWSGNRAYGANSMAMWYEATVNGNNSFLWSDSSATLGRSNTFAVVGWSGMVVNTNAAHRFAKLTIDGSLLVNEWTDTVACKKWVLKVINRTDLTGSVCFCTCDGDNWNSLFWAWKCSKICGGTQNPACGTVSKICDETAGKFVYSWTCAPWDVVEWPGAYMIDKNNNVHWTCETNDGSTQECAQPVASVNSWICVEPAWEYKCQWTIANGLSGNNCSGEWLTDHTNVQLYASQEEANNHKCGWYCKPWFKTDGNFCVPYQWCGPKTVSGYSVPYFDHEATTWVTKDVEWGTCTRRFKCDDGHITALWEDSCQYSCQWTLPDHARLWYPSATLNGPTSYSYSANSTTAACKFRCDDNYTYNSSNNTCEASTQSNNCGTAPSNSTWVKSTFTQTWNGSAWTPASKPNNTCVTTNTSTVDCSFKCNTNYECDGNTWCKPKTQSKSCGTAPSNSTWVKSTFTQTWNGSTWTPASKAKTCVTSSSSTVECSFICDSTHKCNNDWDACIIIDTNQRCDNTTEHACTEWWTATSTNDDDSAYRWNCKDQSGCYKCKDEYTDKGNGVCEQDGIRVRFRVINNGGSDAWLDEVVFDEFPTCNYSRPQWEITDVIKLSNGSSVVWDYYSCSSFATNQQYTAELMARPDYLNSPTKSYATAKFYLTNWDNTITFNIEDIPSAPQCGSAHGTNRSNIPTDSEACDGGSVNGSITPTDDWWYWTCKNWTYTSEVCQAWKNPACGNANGKTVGSMPTWIAACNPWNRARPITGSSQFTWECWLGAKTEYCSANIWGWCGSADWTEIFDKPTSGLCEWAFTPSEVVEDTEDGDPKHPIWSWMCGSYECSARIPTATVRVIWCNDWMVQIKAYKWTDGMWDEIRNIEYGIDTYINYTCSEPFWEGWSETFYFYNTPWTDWIHQAIQWSCNYPLAFHPNSVAITRITPTWNIGYKLFIGEAYNCTPWSPLDCVGRSVGGYDVPNMNHGETQTVEKETPIDNWKYVCQNDVTCFNWEFLWQSDDCHIVCDDNYSLSNGKCEPNTKYTDCKNLPTNAKWVNDKFKQTWNGTAWTPSSKAPTHTSNSSVECSYQCKTHYTWDGDSCEPDTQDGSCGTAPSNSEWVLGTFKQTWNGNAWNPANKPKNTCVTSRPSSVECSFICDSTHKCNNDWDACIIIDTNQRCDNTTEHACTEWWTAISTNDDDSAYRWDCKDETGCYKCQDGYTDQGNGVCVKVDEISCCELMPSHASPVYIDEDPADDYRLLCTPIQEPVSNGNGSDVIIPGPGGCGLQKYVNGEWDWTNDWCGTTRYCCEDEYLDASGNWAIHWECSDPVTASCEQEYKTQIWFVCDEWYHLDGCSCVESPKCGYADGRTYSSVPPTSERCSIWSYSPVSDTWTWWSWGCYKNWITVPCSAKKPVSLNPISIDISCSTTYDYPDSNSFGCYEGTWTRTTFTANGDLPTTVKIGQNMTLYGRSQWYSEGCHYHPADYNIGKYVITTWNRTSELINFGASTIHWDPVYWFDSMFIHGLSYFVDSVDPEPWEIVWWSTQTSFTDSNWQVYNIKLLNNCVSPKCGEADGQTYSTKPSGSVLCNVWTPSTVTEGTNSYTWTCSLESWTPAYCSAPKPVSNNYTVEYWIDSTSRQGSALWITLRVYRDWGSVVIDPSPKNPFYLTLYYWPDYEKKYQTLTLQNPNGQEWVGLEDRRPRNRELINAYPNSLELKFTDASGVWCTRNGSTPDLTVCKDGNNTFTLKNCKNVSGMPDSCVSRNT